MNLDERIKIRKEALTIYACGKMLNREDTYSANEKVKTITINKFKFDSLMIIDMLDELNFIDGKKIAEVFSAYQYIAKGLHIRLMNRQELSTFISIFFGYHAKVERFGKTTFRVLRRKEKSPIRWKQLDFENWNALTVKEKHLLIHGEELNERIISYKDYEVLLNHLME